MGGREIVEGKHHVAVLAQTLAGLGIFVLAAAQEAVVGRQGILSGRGPPGTSRATDSWHQGAPRTLADLLGFALLIFSLLAGAGAL